MYRFTTAAGQPCCRAENVALLCPECSEKAARVAALVPHAAPTTARSGVPSPPKFADVLSGKTVLPSVAPLHASRAATWVVPNGVPAPPSLTAALAAAREKEKTR